ncbi:cardiolipin synthase [Bacillus fonticola]|uniref:cardiolipin synthase n=1 Tax=Bacillus fonticola TaxID=2728853 RepID=UPI001473D019|nr:cardiolipin synthase [Bacillus fonticola]
MTWIVSILILFVVLIWADFQYGRWHHKKHIHKLTFKLRKSDVELHEDGEALFTKLFHEIHKAQHHVHVLFFVASEDDISQRFFALLRQKAREGVQVRLLLDRVGSLKVGKKTVRRLREDGVLVAFCHTPRFPGFFYSLQERNHRKITVIDGNIGFFGGFNIGEQYVNHDPQMAPWKDFHLRFTGEGVEDLQRQFLTDWQEATKDHLVNDDEYFPKLEPGTLAHRFSASEGVELEGIYCEFVQKSRTSLVIGSPYFIPSKKLFQAVLDACERGVQVSVIVPFKKDHPLVKEAAFPYFRKLLQAGGTVYQFQNGFYHTKVLVRDDEVCDIGTANFDKRSLYLNHELNCYFFDRTFVQKVRTRLARHMEGSTELTYEQLTKPNFVRSIKEWSAKTVSYFL